MYTTLEQLEKKHGLNQVNRSKEAKNLIILLSIVGCLSFAVINIKLIAIYAHDLIKSPETNMVAQNVEKAIHPTPIIETANAQGQINELIEKYATNKTHIPQHVAPQLKNKLEQKRAKYHIPFNTLAPNPKLIIHDLQIDVPIVSDFNKSFQEVAKGDFTDELMNGVALFPGTGKPGTKGENPVIFGHSSYQFREKNEFGTTFAKLHTLEPGRKFSIIREGQKIDYKIIAKEIIKPDEIKQVYEKRNNHPGVSYLTLMACYPPGTTLERSVVIAQQIYDKQS